MKELSFGKLAGGQPEKLQSNDFFTDNVQGFSWISISRISNFHEYLFQGKRFSGCLENDSFFKDRNLKFWGNSRKRRNVFEIK